MASGSGAAFPPSSAFTIITFLNLARSSAILYYIFIGINLVLLMILALSMYYYLVKVRTRAYRRKILSAGV